MSAKNRGAERPKGECPLCGHCDAAMLFRTDGSGHWYAVTAVATSRGVGVPVSDIVGVTDAPAELVVIPGASE